MSQGKYKQNFQGKECFSRMNFLYQASMLMAGKNNTLSAYYGELCKNIGKKAVLRIAPNVKRNLCKRCSVAQQPGITSDISAITKRRKRRSHGTDIATIDDASELNLQCNLCGKQRKLTINRDYKFWLENEQSVAEVCAQQPGNNKAQLDNQLQQNGADTNKTSRQ